MKSTTLKLWVLTLGLPGVGMLLTNCGAPESQRKVRVSFGTQEPAALRTLTGLLDSESHRVRDVAFQLMSEDAEATVLGLESIVPFRIQNGFFTEETGLVLQATGEFELSVPDSVPPGTYQLKMSGMMTSVGQQDTDPLTADQTQLENRLVFASTPVTLGQTAGVMNVPLSLTVGSSVVQDWKLWRGVGEDFYSFSIEGEERSAIETASAEPFGALGVSISTSFYLTGVSAVDFRVTYSRQSSRLRMGWELKSDSGRYNRSVSTSKDLQSFAIYPIIPREPLSLEIGITIGTERKCLFYAVPGDLMSTLPSPSLLGVSLPVISGPPDINKFRPENCQDPNLSASTVMDLSRPGIDPLAAIRMF